MFDDSDDEVYSARAGGGPRSRICSSVKRIYFLAITTAALRQCVRRVTAEHDWKAQTHT